MVQEQLCRCSRCRGVPSVAVSSQKTSNECVKSGILCNLCLAQGMLDSFYHIFCQPVGGGVVGRDSAM